MGNEIWEILEIAPTRSKSDRVSRFDHRLEYCYTEEDFREYLDTKTETLPEMFTKFGI